MPGRRRRRSWRCGRCGGSGRWSRLLLGGGIETVAVSNRGPPRPIDVNATCLVAQPGTGTIRTSGWRGLAQVARPGSATRWSKARPSSRLTRGGPGMDLGEAAGDAALPGTGPAARLVPASPVQTSRGNIAPKWPKTSHCRRSPGGRMSHISRRRTGAPPSVPRSN